MRVLGVDPSLSCTGVALIDDGKVTHLELIRTNDKSPIEERLEKIYSSFRLIVEKLKPELVVFEDQYGGRNMQSTIKLVQARAVMALAATQCGCKIGRITPTAVKKAVAFYGNASKEDIIRNISMRYPEFALLSSKFKKRDDLADAVAIADSYLRLNQERAG